jgi:hypothetical protein
MYKGPTGCHLFLTGFLPSSSRETLDFPRSWLLPVIRDHVQETRLGFFTTYFLPLATTLKNKGTKLLPVCSLRPPHCLELQLIESKRAFESSTSSLLHIQ